MAISKTQWDKARGYYEAGLSLADIKERTGIDRSTISKKAKNQQWQHGANTDYIEAKELIADKKSTKNQQVLNIADEIAEEKIRHKKIIYDNATKLADKLNVMADQVDEPQDLKALVEANDKLSITLKVSERHAPKVSVEQNTAVQTNSNIGVTFVGSK